jgi:hypothetical protein
MLLKKFLASLCMGFVWLSAPAQQQTPTLIAPRKATLQNLVDAAEAVVLVHVVAGDAENYDVPIYKAKVLEVFKGKVAKDDVVYFGPYLGTRLGDNYVVFLRHTLAVHTAGTAAPFGKIDPWRVLDQNYGEMEIGYECTFSGPKSCDDAIRVCTDYIRLPDTVEIIPPLKEKSPLGCRWARRDPFLELFRDHVVK